MLNWKTLLILASKGNSVPNRRVEKTEDEWRKLLSDNEYFIMRQHGTEKSFTGEYCASHERGLYNCRACGNPLFDSTIKFESRSGWPSFTQVIDDKAIKYIKDGTFGMDRIEIQCNVCDSHLGHVFPDGPKPSGLRYCVNSASIKLDKVPE